MYFPELYINFKEKSGLLIESETLKTKKDPIPFWASFDYMPCPGNIKHGPEIDHCRLSVEIDTLIHYFSDINSTEQGTLTIQISKKLEFKIKNDAQNLFFHAVWFILLNSQCSTFKFNQWARGNYLPTTDPKKMYYTLFSVFLIEHYFTSPDKLPDIEKFKSELLMLHLTLKNLLRRIRKSGETKADSISNGITLFDTLLIHLLDLINVEGQHTGLEEKIKQGSVLAHWV
jgi:hypothetical protein